LCGISSSSSTVQISVHTRRSVPFQNEQNGSVFGSPGVPAMRSRSAPSSGACSTRLRPANSADSTSATSQSAQTANPRRYSALHCGQIISPRSLHCAHRKFIASQSFGMRQPSCRFSAFASSALAHPRAPSRYPHFQPFSVPYVPLWQSLFLATFNS